MKDLYFEATEEAWAEAEGEPSDEAVETLYRAKIDRLYDAADNARKAEREGQ